MRNLARAIIIVIALEIICGTITLLALDNIHLGSFNHTWNGEGYVTFPIWFIVFHELLHTLGASEPIATMASILGIILDGILAATIARYLDNRGY